VGPDARREVAGTSVAGPLRPPDPHGAAGAAQCAQGPVRLRPLPGPTASRHAPGVRRRLPRQRPPSSAAVGITRPSSKPARAPPGPRPHFSGLGRSSRRGPLALLLAAGQRACRALVAALRCYGAGFVAAHGRRGRALPPRLQPGDWPASPGRPGPPSPQLAGRRRCRRSGCLGRAGAYSAGPEHARAGRGRGPGGARAGLEDGRVTLTAGLDGGRWRGSLRRTPGA
jgi:hypothetical protein